MSTLLAAIKQQKFWKTYGLTITLVGVALVLLVFGIRWLWQRRKKARSQTAQGSESSAPAPERISKRELIGMRDAREQFIASLTLAARVRFRFYRPLLVLGDSADGKSAVISHFLDWQGQVARFNAPYTEHGLVQFYLGSNEVVYELSSVLLQEHSKSVSQGLDLFFREIFRIHPPEVVICVRLEEQPEQQLQRMLPLAQALRGRLDTLGQNRQDPIRVRLVLTHLDTVDGFRTLQQFIQRSNLSMRFPLEPLLEPEAIERCLDPLHDYLNLALRDSTPQEFDAILGCLEVLPTRLRWLPAFLQELTRPELSSRPPQLDQLYLCAVGAAAPSQSSPAESLGNPFRLGSMQEVVAAISRSDRRHRRLAAALFAAGAGFLVFLSEIKHQQLLQAEVVLGSIEGAELGMSRAAFSRVLARSQENTLSMGRDPNGPAPGAGRLGAGSPGASSERSSSKVLKQFEQSQSLTRLESCAAVPEAPPGTLVPGLSSGLPLSSDPSLATEAGAVSSPDESAAAAEVRAICHQENEQALAQPLYFRQAVQESRLLEVGRILRGVQSFDDVVWVTRFIHVEQAAAAAWRFRRGIRQQFLFRAVREGADQGSLGRIYYSIALLYARPQQDAPDASQRLGFSLDPSHWAEALEMPSSLVEDYGALADIPWFCPLEPHFWRGIHQAFQAEADRREELQRHRALTSAESLASLTSPGTPGNPQTAQKKGPARSMPAKKRPQGAGAPKASGTAMASARAGTGSTGLEASGVSATSPAAATPTQHDFTTPEGWSAFLNELLLLWNKNTPREVHYLQARVGAQEALSALERLRRYELQSTLYPTLPHEVRFCLPAPEQSMASLERWTYQNQASLKALLTQVAQSALQPEFKRGMTLLELRRSLVVPVTLPPDTPPRFEIQTEGQRLIFETSRWLRFLLRVRNLRLVEPFLQERALDSDSYLFFTPGASYQPEQLWRCDAATAVVAPGCLEQTRCELSGLYTAAAYSDAMRALDQFDSWLSTLELERPTRERLRSLVQSETRYYLEDYEEALFCYYQDYQMQAEGLGALLSALSELSRPSSSLTAMLEDVARHAGNSLPPSEWEAYLAQTLSDARAAVQGAPSSLELSAAPAEPMALGPEQQRPSPQPATPAAAAKTEATASGVAQAPAGAPGTAPTSASLAEDERSVYIQSLEVFRPVRDAMAGEKADHPRMAAFQRIMSGLANELAPEQTRRPGMELPAVPLDDLTVGLEQYVSLPARYALKDVRGEPIAPRDQLNAWLQELGLDQDPRLAMPFRRPIEALLDYGKRELSKYLREIWWRGFWPQLREKARVRPFASNAEVVLEPEALGPWISPTGSLWEQVERLLEPVLVTSPDGQYVSRRWTNREPVLPPCMLRQLNLLLRLRNQLWDGDGAARALTTQVRAHQLPERVEELAPISVTLRVAGSVVVAFNQRPSDVNLVVPWAEPYSASLEVRALKLATVDDRNRRSEVKVLNDAPEVFGTLTANSGPWAFQELLAQARKEEGDVYTWTVWVARRPVPVSLRIRPDPYALMAKAVQKECVDAP